MRRFVYKNTHVELDFNKIINYEWDIVDDPCHNDYDTIAEEIIGYHGSFNLDGIAGCGKTTLLIKNIKVS